MCLFHLGAVVGFKLCLALERISVIFLHCFSYGYRFQSQQTRTKNNLY